MTVSTGTVFDYETNKTIDVTIVAVDSAGPSEAMSSTVTLTIVLQDVNDVHPKFTAPQYGVTVSEGTPVNATIDVTVKATDEDTGLGGIVSYSIMHTTPLLYPKVFDINNTTGS